MRVSEDPMDGATTMGPMTIRYDDSYRPGACNIGTREVALRRGAGIAGLAVAGLLAAALVLVGAPLAARWIVALPLFGGLVGLLQARRRFCVNSALRGRSNFGSAADTVQVSDPRARAADRRAAIRLIALAGAAAIAVTASFVVLPF